METEPNDSRSPTGSHVKIPKFIAAHVVALSFHAFEIENGDASTKCIRSALPIIIAKMRGTLADGPSRLKDLDGQKTDEGHFLGLRSGPHQ